MKKKSVGFKKNIKKHYLLFHFNIRADPCWVLVMMTLYRYHVAVNEATVFLVEYKSR